LIVLFPTHVLVAVGTGVPPDQRLRIDPDEHRTLRHHGQLFLPVEATALDRGFAAAWDAAAERLKSAIEPPILIDLREARVRFPAAELGRGGRFEAPSLDGLGEIVRELEVENRHRALAKADQLLGSDTPADWTAAGTLLAQLGELERARSALIRANDVPTPGPRSMNNLGNVELMRGRAAEALRLYEAALGIAPERREVRTNAVVAAVVSGRSDRLDHHMLELDPAELRVLWDRVSPATSLRSDGSVPSVVRQKLRRALEAHVPESTHTELPAGLDAEVGWQDVLRWL